MADFIHKPKHRHIKEIPLAPILDLLTVVIFFLILSASFMDIRQNTLPPSQVVKQKDDEIKKSTDIPLNPKFLVGHKNGSTILVLKWSGDKPDLIEKTVNDNLNQYNFDLKYNATELVKEFLIKFPNEKSIQLGFQSDIDFQKVLTIYDGILAEIKEIVLLSDNETVALLQLDK